VGSRLGSGAGPTREAALAAVARTDEGALDRRKDLAAAAAIAAARRAQVVLCAGGHNNSSGDADKPYSLAGPWGRERWVPGRDRARN
jgi:oligoribonuclease NrnB/cAMP/cGMP phosphodiesterase (DHH superfamily)